jgi:basic amino acid/polyamine antiporter, APA family
MSNQPETSFKQSLGLLDGTMLVAGSMIGSGIFIVSADIARNVGGAGWLIAVWLITGFMTITAAVSYGELSGMYPKAGGQYVYLKEAYNPLIGFLYGWSFFAVIETATIAAVAVAFAKFTAYLIPSVSEDIVRLDLGFLKITSAQLLSLAIIAILSFVNSLGVEGGKKISTFLTMIKLISLFGLIVCGLWAWNSDIASVNWSSPWNLHTLGTTESLTMVAGLSAIAAAMVGSVFSSDAWNSVTFIAGEMKNPKRNIGLSLFLGTLVVTIIYMLANIMYTGVLPMNAIGGAEKDRVGVAAAQAIFGSTGTIIIAIMIMISTFGCVNGLILAGSRVYYTMAQDGLFFRPAAVLNSNAVPGWAIWVQCAIACAWSLSGKYGQLLDMISFVVVIFYMMTIYGIFILRKKRPDLDRPYRAFGYPILPLIYIIMGAAFCILLIIYKPQFTWPGLLITLAGIPIYYLAIAKKTEQKL